MSIKATITKEMDKNESYVIREIYNIHKGQYGIWEKKRDSFVFVPLGSAVYISRIINRIDTGEKFLDLFFYDADGDRVDLTLPRKELTEQGIMVLLKFGVQILKHETKVLISSIMNQEPDASYVLQHDTLGFSEYDGHKIFFAKKSIGVESVYSGTLQIGKTGSYKKWKNMVKEEVIGNIPLEFMLAVAGSGVLVDYLREKVQVDNVIVSMVGESSTGKSTAGLFLVSCGAKPTFQGDSFAFNFSDTLNALLASIPSSYPTLIDEGSLCRSDLTKFLYSIAGGNEKMRYGSKEKNTFNTSIVFTSEKSLLNLSDDNTGLLVRVLEIENVVWTQNAQSADSIKNTIYNNYGWLIPKLAEEILKYEDNGGDEIDTMYKEWHEYLVQRAKDQGSYNGLTERVCKQYALIMLSVGFIQNVMGIKLHEDEIIEFIEEHNPVKDMGKADIGSRALIYLMQYITKYYSQFVLPDDDCSYAPQKCLGRIQNIRPSTMQNGVSYSKRLYMADVTLENILREGRFPDKKVILKKWKESGILKCEKDRYLSDIVITGDLPNKGYIINLPDIEEEEIGNLRKKGRNEETKYYRLGTSASDER